MSKDKLTELTEHLRTVNFALMVACLGVLIALFVNTSIETQVAYKQIRDIIHAVNAWDPGWLSDAIDRQLTAKKLLISRALIPDEIEILDGFESNPVRLFWRGGFWCFVDLETPEVDTAAMRISSFDVPANLPPDLSMPYFKDLNLRQFFGYWDALQARRRLAAMKSLSPSVFVAAGSSGLPIRAHRWKVAEGTSSPRELFHLTFAHVESLPEAWRNELGKHPLMWYGVYEPLSERSHQTSLLIPAQAQIISFDGQAALSDYLAEKHVMVDWRRGLARDSFRELNTMTEKYQDLKLEKIAAILESSGQAGDHVEIIGLPIPVKALRSWGLLMILGLQLYFYLHLREFARGGWPAEEQTVAWIALYSDTITRFVFFVFTYLLPTGVVFALGISCFRSTSERTCSARWCTFPRLSFLPYLPTPALA